MTHVGTLKTTKNVFYDFNVAGQISKVYAETAYVVRNKLHVILPFKIFNDKKYAEIYEKYISAIRRVTKGVEKLKLNPVERANSRVAEISDILTKVNNDGDYIDIGCGDGYITYEIGKYLDFKNVYGVDIFPIANKNIHAIVAPQHDSTKYYLQFADDQFAFITMFVSLHHIAVDELAKNVLEIKRILKKGGHLLIREHDYSAVIPEKLLDPTIQFLNIIHIINLLDVLSNHELITYVSKINYQREKYWDSLFAPEFIALDKLTYEKNNVQHLYFKLYRCEKK